MEGVGLSSCVRCYYVGMLPVSLDKGHLVARFKPFGKIIKLKLSKNKSDGRVMGYGYLTIELICSDEEIREESLLGSPPLYLQSIGSSKHLGSAHTRLVRRCALVKSRDAIEREAFLNFLRGFGSLELDVCEMHEDISSSRLNDGEIIVWSAFVVYKDQEARDSLKRDVLNDVGRDAYFQMDFTFPTESDNNVYKWRYPIISRINQAVKRGNADSNNSKNRVLEAIHIRCPGKPSLSEGNNRKEKDSEISKKLASPSDQPEKKVGQLKGLPYMDFDSKRLACTINSNQLYRYNKIHRLLHTNNNLRLNLNLY